MTVSANHHKTFVPSGAMEPERARRWGIGNDGRRVVFCWRKISPLCLSDLSVAWKNVMIQDRGDTIAIRAGWEEDRGRAILFGCCFCVLFFSLVFVHSCMHAFSQEGRLSQ